jgi:hypothetical protein
VTKTKGIEEISAANLEVLKGYYEDILKLGSSDEIELIEERITFVSTLI